MDDVDAVVECPFCGEPGCVYPDVDDSEPGEQVFVQDCEVCCRPWTVRVHVGPSGELTVSVDRS